MSGRKTRHACGQGGFVASGQRCSRTITVARPTRDVVFRAHGQTPSRCPVSRIQLINDDTSYCRPRRMFRAETRFVTADGLGSDRDARVLTTLKTVGNAYAATLMEFPSPCTVYRYHHFCYHYNYYCVELDDFDVALINAVAGSARRSHRTRGGENI